MNVGLQNTKNNNIGFGAKVEMQVGKKVTQKGVKVAEQMAKALKELDTNSTFALKASKNMLEISELDGRAGFAVRGEGANDIGKAQRCLRNYQKCNAGWLA